MCRIRDLWICNQTCDTKGCATRKTVNWTSANDRSLFRMQLAYVHPMRALRILSHRMTWFKPDDNNFLSTISTQHTGFPTWIKTSDKPTRLYTHCPYTVRLISQREPNSVHSHEYGVQRKSSGSLSRGCTSSRQLVRTKFTTQVRENSHTARPRRGITPVSHRRELNGASSHEYNTDLMRASKK